MAQERSPTPEKQLLKIIEDPTGKSQAKTAQKVKRNNLGLFAFGAWKGKSSFLKEKAGKWFKGGGLNRIDIKLVNRMLILLIFVFLLFFIGSVYISAIGLKKMPEIDFRFEGGVYEPTEVADLSILDDNVAGYLEKSQFRDIFRMGIKEVIEEMQEAKPVAATAKTVDAVSHLRLVGISWSDDPDAMIEDTTTFRTYFLKRGHKINDLVIEEIHKDKVVFRYNGEEIELR